MNVRAWVAEALGTFVLVFVGSLAVVSAAFVGQPLQMGAMLLLLAAPFGFGLGLLAAITLFGHVSGGHFNPAVSLAALLDGRIGIVDFVPYLIAQVVGAIGASLTILAMTASSTLDGRSVVAVTINQPGIGDGQAFAGEIVLTAIFVAVILTVTKRQPERAPLVIALVLVMIHFAGIEITGASVNPARSLGPAIVSGNYQSLWVYLTAPFVGALVGWGIYRYFVGEDEEAEIVLEDDEYELVEEDLPDRP